MMSIKGVMLLPLDANCYRRHVAHHTFIAKVNSSATVPDPANALATIVEERAREELGGHLTNTGYRVLRWEQLRNGNHYVERFCELDGIFTTSHGFTVILEVKASASSSSLRTGMRQLRRSLGILTLSRPDAIGLLAYGDLRKWSTKFVGVGLESPEDYFARSELESVDWPPQLRLDHCCRIIASMIPGEVVDEWVKSSVPIPSIPESMPMAAASGDTQRSTLGDFDSGGLLTRLCSQESD